MLHGDRPMPVIPAPLGDRRQRSGIASLGCDLPDHVDPFARLAPDMGEAEEVERGAMRSRVLGALRPLEAEVDEARLVGMEREPIPGKTLAQNSQDPRGIGKGLESHHEIVGVPDKAGSSFQAWSDLYGPGMRWCGLILNGAGSFAQASQMAWNGVRHRSR